MCTVTLVPQKNNGFILTSNRDEDPNRKAIAPQVYNEKGVSLWYPKDALAGGTWIGVSDKQRVVCLLNGGFSKHTRKDSYKMSRGAIVKQLLITDFFLKELSTFDFSGIEPFTIVAVDWSHSLKCYELVWDGLHSHLKTLEENALIWSSSTLYDQEMKAERESWFNAFKIENEMNASSLLKFHRSHQTNRDYGIIMDRGFVKTTSITQIVKDESGVHMTYSDLQTGHSVSEDIFSNSFFGHE